MKLFTAADVRLADAYTIENEPISSLDLMERAAFRFTEKLLETAPQTDFFKIFVGPGNNGGDGLVIARLLFYLRKKVEVYAVKISKETSPDFQNNMNRLHSKTSIRIRDIEHNSDFPQIESSDFVIDALFGSGLSRPLSGLTAELVNRLNNSGATIISVDIPSGLFGEENHILPQTIVKAQHTITFEFPFLSFLLPENEAYVGNFHTVRIDIHPRFIKETFSSYFLTELSDIQQLYRPRKKFSHKGTNGHVLVFAGSYGKAGAQVFVCKAAHRAGAGLVTSHSAKQNYFVLQTSSPETMLHVDRDLQNLTELPELLPYNAIAVGPGIGFAPETAQVVFKLLETALVPLVIDADAITILAKYPEQLKKLPPNCILTPHPKEFERLVGVSENHFARLQKLRQFAKTHQTTVVLKGAFTAVALPDGSVHFNTTGNPGMATGGSGDVLTGILAGLLAQGYTNNESAILGVFLHGLAGDCASEILSEQSLTASDLIEYLPQAWKKIGNKPA